MDPEGHDHGMLDAWSLARVQARAFNGRDVEWLLSCCAPDARCLRDGELVGEGRAGVRDGIEAEYRDRDPVVRLLDVDGEPVLVECGGDGGDRRGGERVQGLVRFVVEADRVTEVRIDHAPGVVERLGLLRPDV